MDSAATTSREEAKRVLTAYTPHLFFPGKLLDIGKDEALKEIDAHAERLKRWIAWGYDVLDGKTDEFPGRHRV